MEALSVDGGNPTARRKGAVFDQRNTWVYFLPAIAAWIVAVAFLVLWQLGRCRR